jgi:hypothetical protein
MYTRRRHYRAALVIIFAILVSNRAFGKVVLDGKAYRIEPGAFGKILSTTETVEARLQFFPEDPQLCDMDLFNTTRPIIPPSDELPVALMVKDDGCLDGVKASIASLDPLVKYLIFFDPDPTATRTTLTMHSEYKTDMGIMFVSGKNGAALLNAIENQSEESASNGGPRIELDGSLLESYIRGRKLLAILPKVPALLSIIGSSYIIYSIIGMKQKREERTRSVPTRTFRQLVLMLSITDISSSLALVLTTWMIPRESDRGYMQYVWDIEFPFAAGNEATCSFQGFLIHFGFMGSSLTTALLAIHFVLIVRYNVREQSLKRVGILFFVFGFLFPLGTAIGVTSAGAMNPTTGNVCWVNTNPYTCWGNPDSLCKGANTEWTWKISFYCGVLWIVLSLLVVIVSMIILFVTVRNQERRTRGQWSDAATEGRRQKQVMHKAMLYIGKCHGSLKMVLIDSILANDSPELIFHSLHIL